MNKKQTAIIALIIIVIIAIFVIKSTSKNSKNEDETTTTETTTETTTTETTTTETTTAEATSEDSTEPLLQYSENKNLQLAIIKTNVGDIKVELFKEQAPKAVENFITHAKNGYYDGVIFHRVIPDFMIQGGDPDGTGMGGESIWGEGFENEISDKLFHFNGALSMANTGQPNSNGSQFFIVQNDKVDESLASQMKEIYPKNAYDKYMEVGGTPHLDGRHTVFGQVIDGMDIVNAIAQSKTDESDKPLEDIIIKNIELTIE